MKRWSGNKQLPCDMLQWQARPGERELRAGICGVKYFDPAGREPLPRGGKGGCGHE